MKSLMPKKITKASFVLILVGGVLLACESDNDFCNGNNSYLNHEMSEVQNAKRVDIAKGGRFEKGLTDSTGYYIDRQLIALERHLLDIFKSSKFNDFIVSKAKENMCECVPIEDFVEYGNLIADPYEQESFKNLKEELEKIELVRVVQENVENSTCGVIENYIPVISVPHVNTKDPNFIPYISTSTSVPSFLPGLEDFEDNIIAYKYNRSLNIFETYFVNEDESLNSPAPIFVVDNGNPELAVRGPGFGIKPGGGGSDQEEFFIHTLLINPDYDRNGKSDIYSAVGIFKKSTGNRYTWNGNNFMEYGENNMDGHGKEVYKMPNDDLGEYEYPNEDVINYTFNPYSNYVVIFNLYERRWYACKKWIGNNSVGFTGDNQLRVSMKYNSHWYLYNPCMETPAMIFDDIKDPTPNEAVFSSWKCYVKMKRRI